MKFIKFLLITLVLLFIALFASSPYYTTYQLKKAYAAHDGETLTSYIDFEQLRPNIKMQLTDSFSDTLSKYPLVAQLGGEALTKTANEFISESVSKAVTKDNVSSLVKTQGQANTATKELAAAWAIASNQVDLQALIQDMIVQRGDINAVIQHQVQVIANKQAKELETHVQSGEDSKKPKLAYCGINCFTISGQVKGYPVTVEMQREGFINWKIINIELP